MFSQCTHTYKILSFYLCVFFLKRKVFYYGKFGVLETGKTLLQLVQAKSTIGPITQYFPPNDFPSLGREKCFEIT